MTQQPGSYGPGPDPGLSAGYDPAAARQDQPQPGPPVSAPNPYWRYLPAAGEGGRHSRALLIVPLVLVILGLLRDVALLIPPVARAYVSMAYARIAAYGMVQVLAALLIAVLVIVLVWRYRPPERFARTMVMLAGAWVALSLACSYWLLPALYRAVGFAVIAPLQLVIAVISFAITITEIISIAAALARHGRAGQANAAGPYPAQFVPGAGQPGYAPFGTYPPGPGPAGEYPPGAAPPGRYPPAP